MGKLPSLDAHVRALGIAIADQEGYEEARLALLEASNEHALLDVAGIIALHAVYTKTVDLNGFYSPFPNIIRTLGSIVIAARYLREMVTFLPRMIHMWFLAKEKQS